MYSIILILASISVLFYICILLSFAQPVLITEYEWKYIYYDWESESQRNSYIHKGDYDYRKNVPKDVDRAEDGQTSVTVKGGPGVPSTLNTVSKKHRLSGLLLSPYPDWSWHYKNDCNVTTSIDVCGRLWILDTGTINSEYICPDQLLPFDLNTDKLADRFLEKRFRLM